MNHKQRISIEEKVLPAFMNHHTSMIYRASVNSKKSLISFRRRNKSQELVAFENINKHDIFSIVYKFVGKLVTDSHYTKELIAEMEFHQDENEVCLHFSEKSHKWSSVDSQDQMSIKSKESKEIIKNGSSQKSQSNKQNKGPEQRIRQFEEELCEIGQTEFTSNDYFQNEGELVEINRKVKQPKISIIIDSENIGSFSNFGSKSSSWFSENSLHLSSIKLPPLILTLDLVSKIYEEPEPFLINLSLCLMMKFLYYSKMAINCENSCWILSIGTIIAYKIYYDEPVGGLIESFSQILQISERDLKDLQRYFLGEIQFKAVISSQQFQKMLTKIISI